MAIHSLIGTPSSRARCLRWLFAAAAFGLGGLSPALAADTAAHVEVRIPWPPAPFLGDDGQVHLAYEMHVTNFYRDTGVLRLRRIAVFAEDSATPLRTFEGQTLEEIMSPRPANGAASADSVPIGPGLRAVAFIWLSQPHNQPQPRWLRHELEFETAAGTTQWVNGAKVAIDAGRPAVLGPPLNGGRWLVVEGPGNSRSHHWGSLVAANGEVTIPQRYALDLFGLDGNGRVLRSGVGDLAGSKGEDWVGFGQQVLAVADGVVRDVSDGAPDHDPLAPQPEPEALTARALYGNYVVLQIAPGVFVHYAHLQRDSVEVKPGQSVRRGAVLGRLGQSGNSNGPHLHLQVSNAATFEESEGLPFVFDAFVARGSWSVTQAIDPEQTFATRGTERRLQMPLDADVIEFPPNDR